MGRIIYHMKLWHAVMIFKFLWDNMEKQLNQLLSLDFFAGSMKVLRESRTSCIHVSKKTTLQKEIIRAMCDQQTS